VSTVGGGGAGFEAQAARPEARMAAARARMAYFIVVVVDVRVLFIVRRLSILSLGFFEANDKRGFCKQRNSFKPMEAMAAGSSGRWFGDLVLQTGRGTEDVARSRCRIRGQFTRHVDRRRGY